MRKIKKILLISPPVTRPKDFSAEVVRVSAFFPLGLAYLAAALEQAGKYELEILDALVEKDFRIGKEIPDQQLIRYGLSDEEITEKIKEYQPDVVGVSCLFAAMQWDMVNVCRIAKEVDERIITITGGAHSGASTDFLLGHFPALDYAVIGEGEDTITELLDCLENGKQLNSIDGLGWRESGNVTRKNEKSLYIEDLDRVPFPARHLFEMDKYFSDAMAHSVFRQSPFTQMITSRGCPCKCSFCALGNHWGPRQRLRSAENVLDEMENLIETYGIREIHFEDDNLTGDKARAIKIFDGMIERGFNITWNVPSGMAIYTLDREILEKMRASGCYSVSLAVENGNQEVIHKLMNKPVNLQKVPGLVKDIRETGMDARGFFILGYPDETRETIRQTIDFARNCEFDWAYFFIASPLPHTKMWDTCVEKGYISEKDFDPIRSFHTSIIKTPEFDPEYLAEIREEAIIDVNFKNNSNLRKYDIDKAIASFKDVVNKYPHFDFANFYLGEAYLKKGENSLALESYRATLKANPEHEEAKQRLAELEKINLSS